MVRKQKLLGEMLIEAGLITEAQLSGALGRQKKWGGRLGTNLVKLGNIGEEDLGRFLAQQTGVKEMVITDIKILPHILKMVPKKIAEKYHLIPVAMKDKRTLIVACADPTDLGALDHISFITGQKVDPVIATFASIRESIDHHYPGATTLTGNESIGLADTGAPNFTDMDDLRSHGGQSATADPELIIFGSQSDNLSPEYQGSHPSSLSRTRPSRPRPPVRGLLNHMPKPGAEEPGLDFNPDWANPASPESPRRPQPAAKKSTNLEQKFKVLLRLLIKKGLVTETELRKEWAELQAKGKL